MKKTFITSVIAGTLATVLGGLLLVWIAGYPNESGNPRLEITRPSAARWEKLADEEPYAHNYARRAKYPREMFPQVGTVFDLPMSGDRKAGEPISSDEQLEFFKLPVSPKQVVMQLRLDRGRTWLLSRQTISLEDLQGLVDINPESDPSAFHAFRSQLQNEVDRTRHILRTEF